jgi:hypothetical protein
LRSGFLFHRVEFGLSAFADTLEGISTWIWLFSPSCEGENALCI